MVLSFGGLLHAGINYGTEQQTQDIRVHSTFADPADLQSVPFCQSFHSNSLGFTINSSVCFDRN